MFQLQRTIFTTRYSNRAARITKFLCNAGFIAIGAAILLKADLIIGAFR